MQSNLLYLSLLGHVNAVYNTAHPIEICSKGMQDSLPLFQIIDRRLVFLGAYFFYMYLARYSVYFFGNI